MSDVTFSQHLICRPRAREMLMASTQTPCLYQRRLSGPSSDVFVSLPKLSIQRICHREMLKGRCESSSLPRPQTSAPSPSVCIPSLDPSIAAALLINRPPIFKHTPATMLFSMKKALIVGLAFLSGVMPAPAPTPEEAGKKSKKHHFKITIGTFDDGMRIETLSPLHGCADVVSGTETKCNGWYTHKRHTIQAGMASLPFPMCTPTLSSDDDDRRRKVQVLRHLLLLLRAGDRVAGEEDRLLGRLRQLQVRRPPSDQMHPVPVTRNDAC